MTAGMATTRPAAVVMSASEIPGATARRVAAPAVPRPWKASMMPMTVPKSPMKGERAGLELLGNRGDLAESGRFTEGTDEACALRLSFPKAGPLGDHDGPREDA